MAFVILAILLPGAARAQPDETERRTAAEALFKQGKELQEKGDYEHACPSIDGLSAKGALVKHCGPDYGSTLCKETIATYDPTADNARKNRDLAMFVGVGGAGALALGAAVVGLARPPAPGAPRTSRVEVIPAVSGSGVGLTLQGRF